MLATRDTPEGLLAHVTHQVLLGRVRAGESLPAEITLVGAFTSVN